MTITNALSHLNDIVTVTRHGTTIITRMTSKSTLTRKTYLKAAVEVSRDGKLRGLTKHVSEEKLNQIDFAAV